MRELVISQIAKYELSDYNTSIDELNHMSDQKLLDLLIKIVVYEG